MVIRLNCIKYKRFICAFMIVFSLTFYGECVYRQAKADAALLITIGSLMAENIELGPLAVLGLGLVLAGVVYNNKDEIIAGGRIVAQKILNAGHTVSEVVSDNTLKTTTWLKSTINDTVSTLPTTYTNVTPIVPQDSAVTLAAGSSVSYSKTITLQANTKYRLYFTNVFGVSYTLLVRSISIVSTTNATYSLPDGDVKTDPYGSRYIDYTPTTGYTTKTVNFRYDYFSLPAGATSSTVKFDIGNVLTTDFTSIKSNLKTNIVDTIPSTDALTFNKTANVTGISSTTVGNIAVDTAGALPAPVASAPSIDYTGQFTGILGFLQKILDAILSIPALLQGLWDWLKTQTHTNELDLNVPRNATLDFSPLMVAIDKFPFCIPFDIVNSIKIFSAERKAPKWTVEFPSVYGMQKASILIDFSQFDQYKVVEILRFFELFGFCWFLMTRTRELIRG